MNSKNNRLIIVVDYTYQHFNCPTLNKRDRDELIEPPRESACFYRTFVSYWFILAGNLLPLWLAITRTALFAIGYERRDHCDPSASVKNPRWSSIICREKVFLLRRAHDVMTDTDYLEYINIELISLLYLLFFSRDFLKSIFQLRPLIFIKTTHSNSSHNYNSLQDFLDC